MGLDHVVGVHRGIDLYPLHMRLGHPGIEAMDLLCMDHWLTAVSDGLDVRRLERWRRDAGDIESTGRSVH